MKIAKSPRQYYITIVSHFQMPANVNSPEEWMVERFAEFDTKVNNKVLEGYKPHGSLAIDHCDRESMDLVQAMVLKSI